MSLTDPSGSPAGLWAGLSLMGETVADDAPLFGVLDVDDATLDVVQEG
jgi:hypothetical protein